MRPTVKRTVLASLVTATLIAGSTIPSFAADSAQLPPTAPAETVVTDTGAEAPTNETTPTHSANAETTNPVEAESENKPTTNEAQPESSKDATPTTAVENTAVAETSHGAANGSVTGTEAANGPSTLESSNQVVEAYANWDFRLSFREYVGVENESISEGLTRMAKGGHLLWSPKANQNFDGTGTAGKLHLGGKVHWTKYDGVLNVALSNITIDFEKRVLLADGYTTGTMAKAGAVEFTQEAIATLPDLQVEKKDGYFVIHSLKPVFTEKVKDLVGFYNGEVAAPMVVTLSTSTSEEVVTPQPVLWELFPNLFKNPINGPVYSDAPLLNVTIPDVNLEKCIRRQYDVAPGSPITNKVLESIQALQCAASEISDLTGMEHAINLTSVNLYQNKLTSLAPLANSSKLVDINVGNNKLVSLKGLENSPKIQILNASNNLLTDVSVIKKMGYINSIDLSENRISDLSQLTFELLDENNDKINTVDLSHNRISDLSAINSMPFVRNLNLSHNLIVDIAPIANKRALETLNLEHNFITDPSPFGKWANQSWRRAFKQLKIRYNKFTDWSSLAGLKEAENLLGDTENKIPYFPNPGEEESLVNPKAREEVIKANEAKDAEIAAAQQPATPDTGTDPTPDKDTQPKPPVGKEYTAKLHWGVKESFTNYIKGPIANGNWELSGGVTGQFNFPLKSGVKLNPSALDRIDFAGTIHFKGHSGKLDLAISAPSVEKVNGKWQLVATVTALPFDKNSLRPAGFIGFRQANNAPVTVRAAIANLSDPTITPGNGGVTVAFTDVILTEAGSKAFAEFYPTGQKLDSLTVNVSEASATDPVADGAQDGGNASTPKPGPGDTPTPNPQVPAFVADLHWGVKESFRDYVKGPIAQGEWVVYEGVTGEFVFPLLPGTTINPRDYSKIDFGGKVQFKGHKGLLDLTISNLTLQKEAGNWQLVATVTTIPFDKANVGKILSGGERPAPQDPVTVRAVVANLSAPMISAAGEVRQITFKDVILTAEGSKAFSDFYPAGQKLDSLTVMLRPASVPAQPDTPKQPDMPKLPDNPKPGKPAVPAQPKVKDTKPAVKQCAVDVTKQRITGGNLAWGVRASFTNYIRGPIASGGWQLGGTSWDGANFNWAAAGGVYNTATKVGTVYYAGSVRFTGHKGILDLTMSNPTVEINGNYGALYLTVSGSDMKGNKFNLGRVHFANLAFNGVSVNGGALHFNAPSVTLTPAGAQAFVGFYKAGDSLAPLGSSVAMVNATACDPATGELIEYSAFGAALPATGAQLEGLLLASMFALLGGVAAIATKRRRVK